MAYRDLILADGPSLYWPLDSTYGATDQSGNGRDGTGAGGISIGGFSGSPIPGEATSTDFDGSDDVITAASYRPFQTGVTTTVSCWVYRDDSSATHNVVSGTANASPSIALITGSQNVRWRPTGNSATGQVTWSGAFPGNAVWTLLDLIYVQSSGSTSLYINGALVSTQTAGTSIGSTNPLRLGRLGAATNPLNGKLAHFASWERALTASEVQSHYRAGIDGSPANRKFIHQAGGIQ